MARKSQAQRRAARMARKQHCGTVQSESLVIPQLPHPPQPNSTSPVIATAMQLPEPAGSPDASTLQAAADAVDGDWGEDEEVNEEIQDGLQLSAQLVEDVIDGRGNVVVNVKVPDSTKRCPVDVCCVVDVSGSMGAVAEYEDENGKMTNDGLNLLDIVKHSVKTIVNILGADDRLAIVAFDHNAETTFSLAGMDAAGRAQAVTAAESLCPQGGTNIWVGIRQGMEELRKSSVAGESSRQKCIMLLTDGQTSGQPIPELRNYLESHPGFSFQLNTFGFGYSINSALLLDLAREGQGTFGFLPDAKIVGTCFVNSIANTVSTKTQRAMLHLVPKGDASFGGDVLGSLPVAETSWGRVVNLGTLQFGHSRDVVVPMKIPAGTQPYLEAVVVYSDSQGREARAIAVASSHYGSKSSIAALCRSEVVTGTYAAIDCAASNRTEDAKQCIKTVSDKFASCESLVGDHVYLSALREDVFGRITKSLSTQERVKRWGLHYLRALARSHQLQLCTNFMDPGLQVYGEGTLFKQLRDEGGNVFLSLPPPQASRPPPRRYSGLGTTQPAPQPTMATYYAGSCGG